MDARGDCEDQPGADANSIDQSEEDRAVEARTDDAGDVTGDLIEVPVSAIEHYSYCPRQCALIHVEQTFDENLFTVRGRLVHERVDSRDDTPTRGVEVRRSMPLWSQRLGLRGKADLVEFRPEGVYPVEYKSGRRRGIHADLQLCAQALCLEEMLGKPVPRGAIYNHADRSRHEVLIDDALRQRTLATIAAIRDMLRELSVPAAANDARCRNCSLIDACLPGVVGEPARLRGLQGVLFQPGEQHSAIRPNGDRDQPGEAQSIE